MVPPAAAVMLRLPPTDTTGGTNISHAATLPHVCVQLDSQGCISEQVQLPYLNDRPAGHTTDLAGSRASSKGPAGSLLLPAAKLPLCLHS